MHVVFKAEVFSVNDWENVHCSGPQISHLPQAKLFPLETQTRQSLCLGKLRVMSKSWLDIILKVVLWAAKCGSHATTSLWMQPGKIVIFLPIIICILYCHYHIWSNIFLQVRLPRSNNRREVCVQGEGGERCRTQPVLPGVWACGGESCYRWVKREFILYI